MSLELVNDSIRFARELALDLEYRAKADDQIEVNAAIHAMNEHLFGSQETLTSATDFPTTLRASEAFLDLPDPTQLTERLHRAPLMSSRIEKAVVNGNIHSFRWLGSTGLALFGIQLYNVDILEPHYIKPRNAFIPVRAVQG
ncbi:MAG: hypothetical protein WAQ27_03365 [Candidatus Microsaccharimonas sp.]